MIVEQRTYTFRPGNAQKFMALYEVEGLPVQNRILGGLVGFFVTEIGTLNQTVALWRYDSLADREARRKALAEDPDWQALLPKAAALIERQEVAILNPAPFSPIK